MTDTFLETRIRIFLTGAHSLIHDHGLDTFLYKEEVLSISTLNLKVTRTLLKYADTQPQLGKH